MFINCGMNLCIKDSLAYLERLKAESDLELTTGGEYFQTFMALLYLYLLTVLTHELRSAKCIIANASCLSVRLFVCNVEDDDDSGER